MAAATEYARMLAGLLRASHMADFEQLPALVRRHASPAGFHQACIYVVDLREDTLREVTGEGVDARLGGRELKVDGTLAGRVFQTLRVRSSQGRTGGQYWLPLLDGTERLGVLGLTLREEPDDEAVQAMEDLASVVGLMLVSQRPRSDSYARLTRLEPMSVSAEMQWTLMPPRTYTGPRITIAAAMEPAYATAGDAFDYALAGHAAHLAIFDAMGHDTAAGLTANLAMATCRNERRQGADLSQARDSIESTLIEQFTHDRYTTAVLADLDLDTGVLSWINCGHLPPILIRAGRWITALDRRPSHPLGTELGLPAEVHREQLQAGDRLILYTDGITEARDRHGREFGLDHFVDFIVRQQAAELRVPETLRRLVRAVLEHHDGRLNDDATVLLAEWHGA
ncbi:PP2C family protein-serine/threonine phosphatase [Streptomyces sp. NK15101]|uniref:PP2C family protein-serine/threonine phosphatase n=1 Tax=Streptomyces sp. NK15101 TaxID=2873261 RepID=UPI001CED65B8|nr:PP2C family protein-serine/threonine phosphatase [Streptomyces sp. NK15101]